MMIKHFQVVIIGAGTAGITVAAQLLLKNKKLSVALIDPAEKHYYQPAFTLVGADTFDYNKTMRPMKSVIPPGATWIQEAADLLNPAGNRLRTASGTVIYYDYLVVCPGLQIDLDGIEGLREAIGKNGVCSVYTDPLYVKEVLQNFKGGNALFTTPATPVKCGGAPQKIMYLADDYFRKTGVRDKTSIMFVTPGSVIFGIKAYAETLLKVVDRKNIALRFFHKPVRIDGPNKVAYFQITKHAGEPDKRRYNQQAEPGNIQTSGAEVAIPYDMLHLAPPQSAPDFIKASPLAHAEGPGKGWLNVNIHTLQHNEYLNVFGLGDVAALPTAKTGAAIRKQAPVVADNILRLMDRRIELNHSYTGYSSCPLVTGYGKMVLAEFGYGNERMPDPLISRFVDTTKEHYSMWLLKKYGLPFMYWNLMLKGKA